MCYQFNSWHKKSAAPPSSILTTGTAKHHVEIWQDKQSAPLRICGLCFLSPSLLPHGSKSRDGHKIGGFVVKGNPKIHSQYFHFPALRPSVYKFNENFHSAKVRTTFLTLSHISDA